MVDTLSALHSAACSTIKPDGSGTFHVLLISYSAFLVSSHQMTPVAWKEAFQGLLVYKMENKRDSMGTRFSQHLFISISTSNQ